MLIGFGVGFGTTVTHAGAPGGPGGPTDPVVPDLPGGTVDLAAATRSLRFPVGNNWTDRRDDLALTIQQTTVGMPLPARGSDSAMVALVRLPVAQRFTTNKSLGIMGTAGINFAYRDPRDGTGTLRNKFFLRTGNINVSTPEWDEDAALVVLNRVSGTATAKWYSVIDGSVHDGETTTQLARDNWTNQPTFNVGGIANQDPTFGVTSLWPGEVAMVGFLIGGPMDDAAFARIALGENPITVAADMGAQWQWLRMLDGTAGSLTTPTAPTGSEAGIVDELPDSTIWTPEGAASPATLQPGSDFLRRDGGTHYIAVDHVVHPSASDPATVSDGIVIGVVPGADSASVRFKGRVGGYTGNVEVLVAERDTGAVVVPWTSLGAIAAGAFDGTVTVPKATSGWYVAQFRATSAPDEVFTHMDRWAVGYKIGWLGQSQLSITIGAQPFAGQALSEDARMTASFLTNDGASGHDADGTHLQWLAVDNRGESAGRMAFAEQMRVFTGGTPIMIVDFAVSGTGIFQLIDDSVAGRDWSVLQHKLDRLGNDISVMVKQWGTSDMSNGDYGGLLDALVSGTGTQAADHNLNAALQPGWAFAVSPLTRHTGGSSYVGNAAQTRSAEVAWANANGVTVGPPVSDFAIEAVGGPHQGSGPGDTASMRLGARMAVAAARALGLDGSQNPHFTGAAWGADQSEIVVSVALPNGGTLASPTPDAVRNFVVDGLTSGFSARIVGNTVVLTKDAGTWAPGTVLNYVSGGENRDSGETAAEAAIVAGTLYETWPAARDDTGGLPVMGSLDGGVWVPAFDVVL